MRGAGTTGFTARTAAVPTTTAAANRPRRPVGRPRAAAHAAIVASSAGCAQIGIASRHLDKASAAPAARRVPYRRNPSSEDCTQALSSSAALPDASSTGAYKTAVNARATTDQAAVLSMNDGIAAAPRVRQCRSSIQAAAIAAGNAMRGIASIPRPTTPAKTAHGAATSGRRTMA